MRRHDSITPLSRDHHAGLLCCWKIRQGIKKNIKNERLQAYLLYFWNEHLATHFQEEEELLFNNTDTALCTQAVREHEQLKSLIERIKRHAVPEDINDFVELLDQHIRFEERVVFPHLEASLTKEQLIAIGLRLKERHLQPPEDDFADEFWR